MGNFWKWLRNIANRRVRETYMAEAHHDRRCPCCDTWTSEIDGAADYEAPPGEHDFMTCGRCGYRSRWFRGLMMPVLDDPLPEWKRVG